MHQDQSLGLNHGDWLVSEYTQRKAYRFRCGPVGHYYSSHNYLPRAYGSLRHPRTLASLRAAQAHQQEGIRVRANSNLHLPTAWDDQFAHAEKCWKRYRGTQYRV